MFFVFGSPRSGTTLLAQTLAAHPDIAVPDETDFIVPLAFIVDRVRDAAIGRRLITDLIIHSERFAFSIGEFLDAAAVAHRVHASAYEPAAILDSLYDGVAKAAGARIAGDKSPNDLMFARILFKVGVIGPDARIVHIVRDLRDVMTSLRRQDWTPNLELFFPRAWSQTNLYLHELYRTNPRQYLLLRYEDLVANPADNVAAVCAHLGVAFRPDMLDPEQRDPRYRAMPQHARMAEPVNSRTVGSHADALDPRLKAACEAQAGEALSVFGYLGSGSGSAPAQAPGGPAGIA
jgi:hypothetical protein